MIEKLSDLKPNSRNPRTITDQKLVMLKKSLDEFGDLGCLVFNRTSQRLVGGHQRIRVLPPDADIVITQEYNPPTRTGTVAEGHVVIAGEKFKYRLVEWSEQKEQAAMIAANQHGGEWDEPLLADLVQELDQADYDTELMGYGEEEVEKMIQVSSYERGKGDEKEDPPSTYVEQYGVIVMCKSASEQELVYNKLKEMGHEVKVVVT